MGTPGLSEDGSILLVCKVEKFLDKICFHKFYELTENI